MRNMHENASFCDEMMEGMLRLSKSYACPKVMRNASCCSAEGRQQTGEGSKTRNLALWCVKKSCSIVRRRQSFKGSVTESFELRLAAGSVPQISHGPVVFEHVFKITPTDGQQISYDFVFGATRGVSCLFYPFLDFHPVHLYIAKLKNSWESIWKTTHREIWSASPTVIPEVPGAAGGALGMQCVNSDRGSNSQSSSGRHSIWRTT